MDFRKLMHQYNKPGVLLYLDPPYLRGGDLYRYKFKMEDFIDLKRMIVSHNGSYLLNLSMTDLEMIDIFGEPDLITEHHRPTTIDIPGKVNKWRCGYWHRF